LKKYLSTAYNLIPWKPGGDHFLLFLIRYFIGYTKE
jgi:hypothetical protein